MNSYEIRQEERRERLQRAAARAHGEARRRFGAADAMLSAIPMGQPILVGHHSERRHRRDLDRIHRNIERAMEAEKAAKELAYRAAAVGTGGISSDDPDAIEKLKEKLDELTRRREDMKRTNAAYRKRDAATLATYGLELEALDASIAKAYSWEKQPYPHWQLKNIGAEIRRLEKRILTLQQMRATEGREEVIGRIKVRDDADENRVCLFFPKDLVEFRGRIKLMGWRWSPTRRAWVRKRGPGVYEIARRFAEEHELRPAAAEGGAV